LLGTGVGVGVGSIVGLGVGVAVGPGVGVAVGPGVGLMTGWIVESMPPTEDSGTTDWALPDFNESP
jgi:hypothetical protein